MKRILLVLGFLVVAAGLFAATTSLTWLNSGPYNWAPGEDFRGYGSVNEKLAADFERSHPGVKVTVLWRDVKQGSMTADAMMAAGTPPDVWNDASGYFTKYLNADYAIALQKYGDVSIYFKNLLDLYTVGGNVYALPNANVAGGFAINLDMLSDIGYTMPTNPAQSKLIVSALKMVLDSTIKAAKDKKATQADVDKAQADVDKAISEAGRDWTTDEFLRLGELLKAKGYPLTAIQAKGGLNSWTDVFLYAFGAAFYKNGDLSKTTINSPQALAGLKYIKQIVDSGYAYPNPLEVNDDDAVELFTTGQVFSSMMQNGHTDYWLPEQLKQGKIKKMINVTFVEAPHAPGIAHTPVYGYQSITVAHKSKDEARNKLVAAFAFVAAGKEFQYQGITNHGSFPTIKDWQPTYGTAGKPSYQAIARLAATAGLQEVGPVGDKAAEVNRLWNTLSEQFMLGKLTAEQFLAQYETQANAVLK